MNMIRTILLAFAFVASPVWAAGGPLAASDSVTQRVRTAIGEWTQGRYKVDEVRRTPVTGLYEVRILNDLFYIDEAATHILVDGDMIDMRSSRNLTRDRMDEILSVRFSDLPLNLAIKQVKGKGTRKIALFEDPNCGYCKKLRGDLMELGDLTIYTFAYPILAPDSETKSRKAWCAPDRVKAWNDLMLLGTVPANDGSCKTPIDQIRELGRDLAIAATPTLFFASGRRLQGYLPPDAFVKMLDENSSQ